MLEKESNEPMKSKFSGGGRDFSRLIGAVIGVTLVPTKGLYSCLMSMSKHSCLTSPNGDDVSCRL